MEDNNAADNIWNNYAVEVKKIFQIAINIFYF